MAAARRRVFVRRWAGAPGGKQNPSRFGSPGAVGSPTARDFAPRLAREAKPLPVRVPSRRGKRNPQKSDFPAGVGAKPPAVWLPTAPGERSLLRLGFPRRPASCRGARPASHLGRLPAAVRRAGPCGPAKPARRAFAVRARREGGERPGHAAVGVFRFGVHRRLILRRPGKSCQDLLCAPCFVCVLEADESVCLEPRNDRSQGRRRFWRAECSSIVCRTGMQQGGGSWSSRRRRGGTAEIYCTLKNP